MSSIDDTVSKSYLEKYFPNFEDNTYQFPQSRFHTQADEPLKIYDVQTDLMNSNFLQIALAVFVFCTTKPNLCEMRF